MTEVLSQEIIDQLLTGISPGALIKHKFIRSFQKLGERVASTFGLDQERKDVFFQSIDRFQADHITVDKSNIQEMRNNVSLMEPEAIFKLGSIEFIPIHICPHCKKYHFAEEIKDIYEQDVPTPEFVNRHRKESLFRIKRKWLTENRTVRCKACRKRFQPTIVISNTMKNVPYFCRLQTVQELEKWFATVRKSPLPLFSVQTETVKINRNRSTLYWDLFLNDEVRGLETCPDTLLTNIINYTPKKDLERMINSEKGIPVFKSFNFGSYYNPKHIFETVR